MTVLFIRVSQEVASVILKEPWVEASQAPQGQRWRKLQSRLHLPVKEVALIEDLKVGEMEFFDFLDLNIGDP